MRINKRKAYLGLFVALVVSALLFFSTFCVYSLGIKLSKPEKVYYEPSEK